MGALASWNDFLAKRRSTISSNMVRFQKANVTTSSPQRIASLWTAGPLDAGAAITTAAAPTKSTTGALPGWENGGSGELRCLGANFKFGAQAALSSGPGVWMLCDRLSHQGGLSGTTTGAQTTNLPTAALTRYTGGVGVMMMAEIYTQIGATATTISVSYTNSASTAGRTSPTTLFGGSTCRNASHLALLPLQVGDVGVKSIESVTLAATTGTAGAFGVTLFKPLYAFGADCQNDRPYDPFTEPMMAGGLPEIVDDACLFWLFCSTIGSTQNGYGTLNFVET